MATDHLKDKYSRMLTRIRLIYITFRLFLKNVVITFFSPVFSGFMLFTALQMSPTKIQCSYFQIRSEPRDESIRAWDTQMLEQPVVNCFTFVCFALILSSLCLAILVGRKNSWQENATWPEEAYFIVSFLHLFPLSLGSTLSNTNSTIISWAGYVGCF